MEWTVHSNDSSFPCLCQDLVSDESLRSLCPSCLYICYWNPYSIWYHPPKIPFDRPCISLDMFGGCSSKAEMKAAVGHGLYCFPAVILLDGPRHSFIIRGFNMAQHSTALSSRRESVQYFHASSHPYLGG